MANEQHEGAVVPAPLPGNWQQLNLPQRFEALRGSPHLVRGHTLKNAKIDCEMRNIADMDGGFSMNFSSPGREGGSFRFVIPHGRSVRGGLEILSSDAHRYDRIFVLYGTSSRLDAKKGPGGLSGHELATIAGLLETFQNHCSPSQLGRHIDVHVILADRER